MEENIEMRRLKGKYITLVLLVSALVTGTAAESIYWSGVQKFKQEIAEVSTGRVAKGTINLPTILEGQSAIYTENDVSDFDKALSVSTSRIVTLQCRFNNPSSIAERYEVYKLEVIADKVPSGSSIDVGDVVLTVSLDGDEDSVVLDKAGNWKFDYRVTVEAKLVESSQSAPQAVFTFNLKD